MHVIQSAPPRTAPNPRNVAGVLVGVSLVLGGGWLGLQAFGSSAVSDLILRTSPGFPVSIAALAGWGVGLLVPSLLVLAGSARVARTIGRARRVRADRFLELAAGLSEDHLVALGVALPDGRRVSALVISPAGIALFAYLPPPGAIRFVNGRCEARLVGRGWTTIEEPLTRARRDADAVRRWLFDASADPLPVSAAVIDEAMAKRTPPYPHRVNGVELVGPEGVTPFIERIDAGLPLSNWYRDRIVARIEAAVI